MNLENPDAELLEKVKGCKTPEELQELANAEGYELSGEELEGMAGGEQKWSDMCEERACDIGDCKTVRA